MLNPKNFHKILNYHIVLIFFFFLDDSLVFITRKGTEVQLLLNIIPLKEKQRNFKGRMANIKDTFYVSIYSLFSDLYLYRLISFLHRSLNTIKIYLLRLDKFSYFLECIFNLNLDFYLTYTKKLQNFKLDNI